MAVVAWAVRDYYVPYYIETENSLEGGYANITCGLYCGAIREAGGGGDEERTRKRWKWVRRPW